MDGAPEATPETKSSTGSLVIKGVIAIAVTVLTLWFAFHDVDTAALKKDLARTSYGIVGLYLVGNLLMHVIRTIRWWILIKPLGNPSWRLVVSSVSIGIPAAFFLPLRLGEFVRPAICARGGIPFGGAMAAVAAERIADGIFNVGLFFVFIRLLPQSTQLPEELIGLSNLALVGFGGGVVFLIAAVIARGPVLKLVEKILSPISENISTKVVGLISTFVDGIATLKSAPRLLGFFLSTAVFWGVNGGVTWFLAQSYVDGLPFLAGPFTIGVTVFAVMIPAGPAFAGTLEAGFRLGLSPFGVDVNTAAAIAVVAHVGHLVFMAAIAGLGFLFAEPTGDKKD